ncbi:hypothetical protein D3C80_1143110 [compost metagenome]
MVTPVALLGPELVTVIENDICEPTAGVSMLLITFFSIERSATAGTGVSSKELISSSPLTLLFGVESGSSSLEA